MVCPYCKNTVPEDSTFCPYCNSPLPGTGRERGARSAASAPVRDPSPSAPGVADWQEQKEAGRPASSPRPSGRVYTIPGLGKVSASDLATPLSAKPSKKTLLILLAALTAILLLVGGALAARPLIDRAALARRCSEPAKTAAADRREWSRVREEAHRLLSLPRSEFTTPDRRTALNRAARQVPKRTGECEPDPQGFASRARILHEDLALLKKTLAAARTDHEKTVSDARDAARTHARQAKDYAKQVTGPSGTRITRQADAILSARWRTAADWRRHDASLDRAVSQERDRQKKKQQEHEKKPAPKNIPQTAAPAPAPVPRTPVVTPRRIIPRRTPAPVPRPVAPAPQTWSVPGSGCSEGCL